MLLSKLWIPRINNKRLLLNYRVTSNNYLVIHYCAIVYKLYKLLRSLFSFSNSNNVINNNMKRLIIIILALFASIAISAQTNSNVLKFMGIPVDGSKTQVIQKLKEKGFKYDSINDCLIGQFNGCNSDIFISTNKNKVDRIVVKTLTTLSTADIRVSYNSFLQQFNTNNKYVASEENERISEDEDISYEMIAHDKRYEAVFYLKENITQGMVWFMIYRSFAEYSIAIYYDNLNNRPNGEDL